MQVVWIFLVFLTSVMAESYERPIIKIKDSEILGTYRSSYKGRTYSAFKGLPYGKPPVGNLRFEEPQSLDEWPPKGQLVANRTYTCMSFIPFPGTFGIKGTEDCLYTYVYVPRKEINGKENLDVVVHIHGGAFMYGSPRYMAGPDYLMDRDLVVVTINYRLGILGFLSTEDEVVPGNMGLKDQSLALKWIKENIKYFGGNPDSITITGLSAGGASVHYHYLSPLSKGLFHRGLSQSGTVLQPWVLTENPLAKAKFVASGLDCPTESTKDMVACLKTTPGTKLVNGMKKIFTYLEFIPYVPFGPVVEKAGNNKFLRDHPYKLLKKGDIFDVPWINTNTIDEGIFPVGFFFLADKIEDIDENWNRIMVDALDLNDTLDDANKIEVIQKITRFYLKDEHITIENIYSFIQVFTDRLFLVDSEKATRSHSKRVKAPVYYYLFSYALEMPSLVGQIRKRAGHGDDTRFLFKMRGNARNFQGNDAKMMDIFTEFLSEFARTGKPVLNGVEWKQVDPSKVEIDYLHVGGPDDIAMKKTKNISRSKKFWRDLPIRENNKI